MQSDYLLPCAGPAMHPDDLAFRQGGREALDTRQCEFSYLKRRRIDRGEISFSSQKFIESRKSLFKKRLGS
jgi:hypothetical protein